MVQRWVIGRQILPVPSYRRYCPIDGIDVAPFPDKHNLALFENTSSLRLQKAPLQEGITTMASLPENVLLGCGNPLLDIQAVVGKDFLDKWGLKENDAILCDDKHNAMIGGSALVPFPSHSVLFIYYHLINYQWILNVPNRAAFFGAIGNDKYGDMLKSKAKEAGVNAHYQINESVKTGTCAALIHNQHRSLCAHLAAANTFTIEHMLKPENAKIIESAQFYYIAGFFLTVSPPSIMHVAEHSYKHGKTFMFNLAAPFISQFFFEPLKAVMPYVDVLFGNEDEAAAFAKAAGFDTTDLKEIARKAAAMEKKSSKPRTVIITQGADPVIVATGSELKLYPVPTIPKENVVDTNGAGDAFVGEARMHCTIQLQVPLMVGAIHVFLWTKKFFFYVTSFGRYVIFKKFIGIQMNIDDNGNSYAEMQAVPFTHSESSVPSEHDMVGEEYGQIPVIMSDGEGKEFMVHFADDRDMENMEEELELGVGNEGLKISYPRDDRSTATPEGRSCNPIPDQERFLPIANVARVMKRMIPSSGKIAKDAKECVQECVSEFISFITSEANDKCMSEKRKTISADDLLEAINNMGFDNYVAPLQLFLERYRAAHKLGSGFNHTNTPRTLSAASNHSPTGIHSASRDYSRPMMTSSQSISSSSAAPHSYQATTSSHGSPDLAPSTSSSNGAPVVLAGGLAGMSVTALQQQPMQIYIDPASKQHYMAIETEQGMQLYPIQIQTDGPVAYSFAPEVSAAISSTVGADNQTFIMMAAADDPNTTTMTAQPSTRGQTTTTPTSNSSSCTGQAPRTHGHSEFNLRAQPRTSTTTANFAGHPSHNDGNAPSRPITQKRPGPSGGKGTGGKVVAAAKRNRHS
ncbi:hypothetical protein GCK32_000786 [Trichostrongylus colubriformis]|uniref:Adenosine kinase n=1 Tax=Trichostrongylus colubriformis TaxID=6319 RepID=A0AAN8IHE7_TRICO